MSAPAGKRRLTIYVRTELADRGVAAAARIPGVSLSQVCDEMLEGIVPILEHLAEAVETQDPGPARKFVADQLSDLILRNAMGEGVDGT